MKSNKYVVKATNENPALTESNKMFKAFSVIVVIFGLIAIFC